MSNTQSRAAHLQELINTAGPSQLRAMVANISELYEKQCNTLNDLRDACNDAVVDISFGRVTSASRILNEALKKSEP